MEFFRNRIIAKSTPENFEKETSWSKNNTVREFWSDEKIQLEKIKDGLITENLGHHPHQFIWNKEPKFIIIKNAETEVAFLTSLHILR